MLIVLICRRNESCRKLQDFMAQNCHRFNRNYICEMLKMIPRIKQVEPMADYLLHVVFDDGKVVLYDVKEDMRDIPSYAVLRTTYGLFGQAQLDESRTCIFWNDEIDLPSDAVYEYGKVVKE